MTNEIMEVQKTLDSREVAEMVRKRHNNLVRDIEGYIQNLENSNLSSHEFFIEGSYKVEGNKRVYKKFDCTKKGCEFIAHKLTGQKGAIFTAKYINRFHEMEQVINSPLELTTVVDERMPQELKMFKLLYDGMVNQAIRVNELEDKITQLEENQPQNIKIPCMQVSKIEIQAMEHIIKKDRISTSQIASRYGLSAKSFNKLLNTLGFIEPANEGRKGWKISQEYVGKGIGMNDDNGRTDEKAYSFVQWSPKGRELIEETLRQNGLKPIKRLAPKRKNKARSSTKKHS